MTNVEVVSPTRTGWWSCPQAHTTNDRGLRPRPPRHPTINHEDQPGPFGDGPWREEQSMKRLVTSAALIAVLVCAGSALAHGSTVRVSGIQAAGGHARGRPRRPVRRRGSRDREAPEGAINAMAGSLIGCWYTDTGDLIDGTPLPDGVVVVAGTEHFVGCLDISHRGKCTHADPTGSLALTYTFEAQFSSPSNEIWGGCQHGIVPGMGTGGLAGAAGWLDFTDNVTNGTAAYDGLTSRSPADAEALTRQQPPPHGLVCPGRCAEQLGSRTCRHVTTRGRDERSRPRTLARI